MKRSDLARVIDHTILKPETARADVQRIAQEARSAGCASACVNSARIADAAPSLAGTPVRTCTVIGFPFGCVTTASKVAEVRAAAADGADEFDMVLDFGLLLDGDLRRAEADIRSVREATPTGAVLKVILETGALDEQRLQLGCKIAAEAGADFVKTSTGFHPSGGATLQAVELMRRTVPTLGVKALAGIRDLATAQAMLDAGASRLGMSATLAVLAELPE